MMFRNQTRRGIRAVLAGRDPVGLCRDPVGLCRDTGWLVPTYCNDTVTRMAPGGDPTKDRERMREIGRRLAESYLKDPPLLRATAAAAIGDGGASCKTTH